MKELDTVVLTRSIPDHGLVAGDVGAIVSVYDEGSAYEVEFVAADGSTIALVTLEADHIRPRNERDILHGSELTS